MAARISQIDRQAASKLLLHVEIPLLHITWVYATNVRCDALADQGIRSNRTGDRGNESVRERIGEAVLRSDSAGQGGHEGGADRSARVICRGSRALAAS